MIGPATTGVPLIVTAYLPAKMNGKGTKRRYIDGEHILYKLTQNSLVRLQDIKGRHTAISKLGFDIKRPPNKTDIVSRPKRRRESFRLEVRSK